MEQAPLAALLPHKEWSGFSPNLLSVCSQFNILLSSLSVCFFLEALIHGLEKVKAILNDIKWIHEAI